MGGHEPGCEWGRGDTSGGHELRSAELYNRFGVYPECPGKRFSFEQGGTVTSGHFEILTLAVHGSDDHRVDARRKVGGCCS